MKEYIELFNQLKQYKNNEEYLDNFINLVRKILYERDRFVKNSEKDELRDTFFNTVKEIFLEIFNNINMSDNIEFIGCGHTSLAFKIGDKVIKISKENNNNVKHKDLNCLIPVYINKNFKVDEREYYTIQVSPYVDTKDIKEEEIYRAYKNLREQGYIWNDPTPENVGRIINDIETENCSLKKGDLVIIDWEDFAYVGEDTPDIVLDEIAYSAYNRRTYEYEIRYLEEKGKRI